MTGPELIITGAQLWDPAPSRATAVAVTAGRISAVSDDETVRALASERTEHVEAGGAALLPGFHDAHVHALAGGIALRGCDLETEHSVEGYTRLIRKAAAGVASAGGSRGVPGGAARWVVGSGWFGDAFPGGLPTRELLDAIVPDLPAVLTSHDAHGVWVNTRALELAGITEETPDPPAGRIVRDAAGVATGVLFDTAGELVTGLVPPSDPAELRMSLLAAQERLFSLGITAWHDAILGTYLTLPDSLPSYLETLADGSLRARVTGSMWWPPGAGPEYLPEMRGRIAEARAAGFAVSSVKIMQDGICENCTAALIEPYTGVTPSVLGDSVIPPSQLAEITTRLDAAGIAVHFHGVGDRAVRECLDAVAAARSENGEGQRHQIAHLDLVDPADVPRFAELGVTANLQPLWARNDQEILERKLPLIGEVRARSHFPFGSLARAGAHLAMGSDWPVTSPDPLWGMHSAATRTAPEADVHARNAESRTPVHPAERLAPAEAIRAYTLGSAEVAGVSEDLGRVAVGALGDLVLLTGPLGDPGDFDRVRVARTVLGGATVYIAPQGSRAAPSRHAPNAMTSQGEK